MSLAGESSPVPSLIHRDPEGQDHSPGIDLPSVYPISCPLIPPIKLQGKTSVGLTSHLLPSRQLQALKRGWGWVWPGGGERPCRLQKGLILPLP